MKKIKLIFQFFCFSVFLFFSFLAYSQPAKLDAQRVEIDSDKGLRLEAVPYSTHATPCSDFSNPQAGDLCFDGSNLRVCDPLQMNPWVLIDEPGNIFFDSDTNKLSYYDGSWTNLGGGAGGSGAKTVAAKIVGVRRDPADPDKDSLDASGADYVCDGAGDQAEIQSAIDDVAAAGGGAVYLLEGIYEISGPINITSDNVSLIGVGAGTILKISSGVSGVHVINVSSASRIFISKLAVDGDNQGGNNKAIYFNNVIYSKINKVWLDNVKGEGIHLDNSSNYNIISHFFANVASGKAILLNSSDNNTITQNPLVENGVAVSLNNSNDNIVMGNLMFHNVDRGIEIYSSSDNNNIEANIIVCSQNYQGIDVRNSSYNIISANVVPSNKEEGILLRNFSEFNNIINNNIAGKNVILYNHTCSGSYFYKTSLASCGCQDKGIRIDNSNHNLLVGNIINKHANQGMQILNSDETFISSNRIVDDNLEIDSSSNDSYLVGNYVTGASIIDNGINTRYTQKEKITIERQDGPVAANGTLNVAAEPKGYVVFNSGGNNITLNGTTAIANGKAVGDTLILEGPTTGSVTIEDGANINLKDENDNDLDDDDRILSVEDTLTLIWNGNDWLEIDFANN